MSSDSDANNPFAEDLQEKQPSAAKSSRPAPARPQKKPTKGLSARPKPQTPVKKTKSMNPFGDSSEEEEEEVQDKNQRHISNDSKCSNPFGAGFSSEEEPEQEVAKQPEIKDANAALEESTNPFGDVESEASDDSLPKNPAPTSQPENSEKFNTYDKNLNPFDDDQEVPSSAPTKTKRNAPKAPSQSQSKPQTSESNEVAPSLEIANNSAVPEVIVDDNDRDKRNDDKGTPSPAPRGKKQFRNLRPARVKLDLAQQKSSESETTTTASEARTTSKDGDHDNNNKSNVSEILSLQQSAQRTSCRSSSPKRRAPDAPQVAKRENDSNIDLSKVLERLDRINLDLGEIREEMNRLQPVISAEAATKADKKKWDKIVVTQTELTIEQSELFLKKELYQLCDRHGEIEHEIRNIQGKSLKSGEDESRLEELCVKLTRIVNQKALLEDQINPQNGLGGGDLKKKKGMSIKFNPKKMVSKALKGAK